MTKQTTTTQFFYQNGKLITVNQGGQHRGIFRNADTPLAEVHTGNKPGLLATDSQGSVLAEQGEEEP